MELKIRLRPEETVVVGKMSVEEQRERGRKLIQEVCVGGWVGGWVGG